MDEPDRNGDTVHGQKGSYSNLSLLGKGGFKVAYSATDDQNGNEVVVAFPTMTINGMAQNPDYHHKTVLKTHKNEIHILKNIVSKQQPHSIIRFIDESKNGTDFMVMEKGGISDVEEMCTGNPISQNEIVKITTDILHGLDFLHRKQSPAIIHRDIKPGNIMVKKNGTAVLIDFGTAKQGFDQNPSIDRGNKTGFFSAGYACPHYKAFVANPECDLYGLGRVMFFMATGLSLHLENPPGSGIQKYYPHKIIPGKLSKKLHEIPNTHVTKEFSELVDEMCDPQHRGLTASGILSRLRTLSSSKPILKKPKPLQAAYNVQSAGGGSPQVNVYPPARIILNGIQRKISDHDDGRGNIIPANILIGKDHDTSKCQQQHGGCNISNKSSPDYQGENITVGDINHGSNCQHNCPNPSHFISRHHLRVFRNGGEVCVINNTEKKLNQRTGVYYVAGKSAIYRNGTWKPMTHKTKEVLKNRDIVALLWNKDKGDFMSFTFYTQ